uniref:Ubiquitin-like protease family profile domain-containing protein n=1 Tax=Aegilops tauschii TaxID=37682 RepID=M8BTY8_AEGTA
MAFNSQPKKLGRFHTGASKMETTVKSPANGEKHVSEMTDETLLSYWIKSIATFAGNLKETRPYEVSVLTVKACQSHEIVVIKTHRENNKRYRLAKSFDSETSPITIGKTPIPITAEDVHHIFGLAIEGEDIDKKGNLPLLQVVMEICARQPEANNRKDPGSQKFVRVDEGDSSRAQSHGQNMSSHQVEMIVAAPNARCAEQEKKIGRQLMEFHHRFDAEFLTLSEELIDIKSKSGSNPRLSLLEDEIKDLRRVLKELKNKSKVSRQSESQKAGVEEQVNVCSDPFMATPKFDASTPRTSTPTPSARHVLPNKDDPQITPMKPLFDNDYVLTAEDKEAAIFIRGTHGPVEVVQIGDIPLRAKQLKPIYDKKYICGDVIMAYAHISGVETDITSVISPNETRKLLQTKGVIPKGHGSSWVQHIANKFVGRWKVHIPLDVNDNHWMAMVFNFDKEEIQILNSLKNQFDESKETALVEAIQACMDEAVKDGLVTPAKPIKFTDWGVAETYEAHVASQPMGSEDDVQEIMGTVECKMSDTSSSPKDPDTPSSPKKRRGRGRPRKLVDEVQAKKTKTMEELRVKFHSKTIAKQVASSMSRRSRKPSQTISSPFKLTKW